MSELSRAAAKATSQFYAQTLQDHDRDGRIKSRAHLDGIIAKIDISHLDSEDAQSVERIRARVTRALGRATASRR